MLADSQANRAKYDSAQRTLQDAVARAGSAGDSATVSRAWTSLSIVARHSGRLDDAQSLGERSVALKRRLGLNAELARSLNALGTLANDRGNYDAAVVRLREARDAAEAVHDSVYVARARGNLGLAYANMGDLDRARTELLAFRDFAVATHSARDEGNALNNLGLVETRAGDPVAAIAWLGTARSRYALIADPVGEENALGQLGVAWQELGENARALAYFDSALALATKKGLLEPETNDLGLIAELYEDAGDHRRALEVLGRARRLADSLKLQSKLGQFLFTEARAYASLGMPSLALSRATDAASREHAADSPIDELAAQLKAAELAQRLGDAAAATRSLARAQALADQLGSGIARIQFALGAARVADAAKRSDDVLAKLTATPDTSLLTAGERSEAEALRARALFRKRDYVGAAAAGRRAVDAVERLSRQVGSPALRTSYTADRARPYADLVIALLAQNRVNDAFRVADAARGRALIDQLGAARRELPHGGAAGELATADSLLRRINALVEQLRIADTTHPARPDRGASAAASPAAGAVLRALTVARASYDSLSVRTGRAESRGAIVGASGVDVAAIKRSLARDERLVEYFAAEDRLLIFVLSRESTGFVEVPIASLAIGEQARLARDLIAGRHAATAPLSTLYASLIRPLETGNLLAGARGLVVVPHGALTYLPFSALRDSPRSPYLAERFSIITLTSASALVPLRQSATVATNGGQVFAPLTHELPASRDEATAVSRALTAHAEPRRRRIGDGGAPRAALGVDRARRVARSSRCRPADVFGCRVGHATHSVRPGQRRTTGDARGAGARRRKPPRLLVRVRNGAWRVRGDELPQRRGLHDTGTSVSLRGREERRRDIMANRRPRGRGIRDAILPGAIDYVASRRARGGTAGDDPRRALRRALLLGRIYGHRRWDHSIRSRVVDASMRLVAQAAPRGAMRFGALAQILELPLQVEQFVVAEPLHIHQLIPRRTDRSNQLVELELSDLRVAILSILNDEHHQKGHDGRSGVDDQLPGVRESEDRTGDRPGEHDRERRGERPRRPYRTRESLREPAEPVETPRPSGGWDGHH